MRQLQERINVERKELDRLIKRYEEVKSESSKQFHKIAVDKKVAFINGLEEALKIIEDANKYYVE